MRKKQKKSVIDVDKEAELKQSAQYSLSHDAYFKKRAISNVVKHDHATNRRGFKKH